MEEENICRVCRCEGTPEDPLFYPCLCSGSIKYIHQDCLVQWLQHSKKKYCELCNHPFSFSPVYDESMPQSLPKKIFLVGALQKMIALSKIWIRYCLVVFSWLIVVPFFTTQIWSLYFPRETEVEYTLKGVASDCLTGAVISGSVVATFLGLMSLRDYIVSHAILRDQVGRAAGGQRGRRERRPAAAAAAAAPAPEVAMAHLEDGIFADPPQNEAVNARMPDPIENWENETQFPDFRGWDEDLRPAVQDVQPARPGNAQPLEEMDDSEEDDPDVLDDDFDDSEDEDSEDDGVEDEEEADNDPADIMENQPANEPPAGLQEGPHEELSFEELVGLKGSIFILFENVFWMLLFNAVFLGTFAFLPYATGNLLRQMMVSDSVTQKIAELLGNASYPLNVTLPAFLNTTLEAAGNSTETQNEAFDTAVNRAVSIFLGYTLLACFILFYMAVSASMLSQDSPFNRYLMRATRFCLVFLKVSVLLLLELALFPLMCGCVIDLITLDLFSATWASHLTFFHSSPFTFLFIHWFLGNTYMFHFSTFVSLLRDILRPGVLWFLRNPNDPSFQPMREMIELPFKRHIKRIFVSAIFYNLILLVMVYEVIQLAKHIAPSLFPLNINMSDPLSELPIDLLLIHVFPIGFERANLANFFTSAVKLWFRLVSRALCLSSYLLGKDYEDEFIPGTTLATVLNKDAVDLFNQPDPAEEEHNTTMVYCPPHFKLRIGGVLTLLTLSAVLFNTTSFFLPILIGRFVFSLFVSRSVHELYTFGVGLLTIWAATMIGMWAFNVLSNSRSSLTTLRVHTLLAFKFAYLFFFGGLIIPLFLGLLTDLTFVKPATVAPNQSAVFFLFQDYALGALEAKVLHRFLTAGPENRWRPLLEPISWQGIQEADLWAFSSQFLFPLTGLLLVLLVLPMAVSLGLLPLFGFEMEPTITISRYSHFLLFLLVTAIFLVHSLLRWVDQLQQSIRDEKYLVGQRLHNLDRTDLGLQHPSPPLSSSSVADPPPPLVN